MNSAIEQALGSRNFMLLYVGDVRIAKKLQKIIAENGTDKLIPNLSEFGHKFYENVQTLSISSWNLSMLCLALSPIQS